jgi:integrase
MATIEKRRRQGSEGGLGPVRWRAYYRDPEGRQRSRTFRRRADADNWLRGVLGDIARGDYLDPAGARTTFKDYVETWRVAQVHRPTTAQTVESDLRLHVLPAFGALQLGSIRPTQVQAWVKGLSAKLSPATVERCYRYLAAIFASAVADDLIRKSPCRGIALPRLPPTKVVPWPTENVLQAIQALPHHYRALGILAASTGLREGELLGLTLPRIDMLRRTIDVAEQLVTVSGRAPFLAPPKTEASVRTVPLPEVALDALAAHLATRPAAPVPCHRLNPRGEVVEALEPLVFTTLHGAPVRRQTFNNAWVDALARAGLTPGTHFHALRHYYASMLIAGGEDVKVVQVRLGHASARETLDTYGHLWPDRDGRTRDVVDSVFGSALAASAAAHLLPTGSHEARKPWSGA